MQAVSGFAYTDAGLTPLASPATGNGLPATQRPGIVTVTAGTTTLASVTTGAGSTIADPAGTMVNGTTGSGAVNAVSFTTAQSAAANIRAQRLRRLCQRRLVWREPRRGDRRLSHSATGGRGGEPDGGGAGAGARARLSGARPELRARRAAGALVAGGTGFAISAPTTIRGRLTLDAPVNVNGGQLTLNTNAAGTLTFAVPLQYNPTGQRQSLTIDGHAYTLITTEAKLVALNGTGNGTYDALAASFTSTSATGNAYAAAPIASYAGTLEGLGNTISGLTINAPGAANVGLIGTLGAAAAKAPAIVASIGASANEAFAGTYGFLAPVMGPLAVVPAAAAEALVMAKAALPSFAVGHMNLPSDMIAQVHAGEMIVPASPAAALRDMMSGGGAQTPGGDTHVHLNVSTDNAQSFERYMHSEGGLRKLSKALGQYQRLNPSTR